ncbi:hypothetical protein AUJ40_02745 [Candidatus Berkelbacteria bacterium CG1_02_42_45]|uniref:SpoVT-AbrB domain-containing protein n=2 Tax=Candidatus Berkelbacteria TaxID=1618330 RepID=A0A2H0Q0K4_9BACT|nr:MAG: hypothetical protein AUJ40_02745 [Candidatus Berkelbacteria bacterium CG1_02_42_45]PIR27055.1 MAG: hypothetical protein COV40_02925 [Candidatus Berkelbacteria bacterium CG11_big_fil_rev_8_21_14_0_20_42_15]
MPKTNLKTDEQWLKILGKGMITIPKKWRSQLNINIGNLVRARKNGDLLIIEPPDKPAPYRVYSQKELESFIASDQPKSKKNKNA